MYRNHVVNYTVWVYPQYWAAKTLKNTQGSMQTMQAYYKNTESGHPHRFSLKVPIPIDNYRDPQCRWMQGHRLRNQSLWIAGCKVWKISRISGATVGVGCRGKVSRFLANKPTDGCAAALYMEESCGQDTVRWYASHANFIWKSCHPFQF